MRGASSAASRLCRAVSCRTTLLGSWTVQRIRAECRCSRSHFSTEHRRRPGPLALYKSMVEDGKLHHDIYQENVASELEDLLSHLDQYEKEMEEYHINLASWECNREDERRRLMLEEAEVKQKDGLWARSRNSQNGFLEKWIKRRKGSSPEPGVGRMVSYLNREKKLDSLIGHRPVLPQAPKGIYIYGNVGSGKTMLMDMFYSATDGIVKHRRRFHFHEAMLEINERMHNVWKNSVENRSIQPSLFSWINNLPFDLRIKEWLIGEEIYKHEAQEKHILPAVADKFLIDRQAAQNGASVLCFDEIQTVDVFAIVSLSGIVSRLLSTGTVLVATSNRAPEDLNQVHYFWPCNSDNHRLFDQIWKEFASQSGERISSSTIPVMFGRMLEVPESCSGVARFNFEYLCGRPARRFITLIDELYNHHCCLLCLADSSIEDLFQGTDEGSLFDLESFQFETETESGGLRRDVLATSSIGSGPTSAGIVSLMSGQEELFAFRRAVSRLIEMQKPLYVAGVRRLHPLHRRLDQQLQCDLPISPPVASL
ncbi:hypothetical protein AXF42_Ash020701 [Apostasia shenzhenica]|uniref:Lactation elevated protein 1 n=1 Tax=Apostasia shenzhenica TaxID=1088818 RepID=A0A2I0ADZ4_9ASPA|nr:hypothetical protein AXF42_Ash020701 [Apostasia shenzhenica]